jgi:hypothetical protein
MFAINVFFKKDNALLDEQPEIIIFVPKNNFEICEKSFSKM